MLHPRFFCFCRCCFATSFMQWARSVCKKAWVLMRTLPVETSKAGFSTALFCRYFALFVSFCGRQLELVCFLWPVSRRSGSKHGPKKKKVPIAIHKKKKKAKYRQKKRYWIPFDISSGKVLMTNSSRRIPRPKNWFSWFSTFSQKGVRRSKKEFRSSGSRFKTIWWN